MTHFRVIPIAVVLISVIAAAADHAFAQRIYSGSTPSELQYPRSRGLDSNGRATDVDGRSIDQYGFYTDDYGRQSATYGVPGHYHGNGYAAGGYYPGGYSGLGYSNSLGYSVGLSGYSGGYNSNSGQFGARIFASNNISPPRSIIVGGVYPSRTVMNNATRGGVLEYTHNGNGYIYSPGSSYQTVISSGPSIFPLTSVIQPSQPPVIIETHKKEASSIVGVRSTSVGRVPEIKLVYPKAATSSLSYSLNGTAYSIKPGYVQTFGDDRVWTIEFFRGGNQSQIIRYQLTAGTFVFDADENGWDLKQSPTDPGSPALPAPPVPAPIPAPDL